MSLDAGVQRSGLEEVTRDGLETEAAGQRVGFHPYGIGRLPSQTDNRRSEGHYALPEDGDAGWVAGRPKRIQRQRTRGWRMPEDAIYVGRPGPWGNPFRAGEPHPVLDRNISDAAEAVKVYRDALDAGRLSYRSRSERRRYPITTYVVRQALAGHDLACWCPLDQPCHADVLLQLANQEARTMLTTDEILDQIDGAVHDWEVGPDAMRSNPAPPDIEPAASMRLAVVMFRIDTSRFEAAVRRLTEQMRRMQETVAAAGGWPALARWARAVSDSQRGYDAHHPRPLRIDGAAYARRRKARRGRR